MNTPPDPSEKNAGDFRDKKDADRKELCAYAAGSITDDVGNIAFSNLNSLLVIGFSFSPILVSMLTAIRVLWDGIMDPIVANLSDNSKSRFGRRRPFILAGSLLMAAVSWFTWHALPDTDRVQSNTKPVPEHFYSEQVIKDFGRSLIAYQSAPFELKTTADAGDLPVAFAKIVDHAASELRFQSKNRIQPARDSSTPSVPTHPLLDLDFKWLALDADRYQLTVTSSMDGSDPVSRTATVTLGTPPLENLHKPPTNVFELIRGIFAGPPAETGMVWEMDGVTYRSNVLEERGAERAALVAARISMMATVARYTGVPYTHTRRDAFEYSGSHLDELWSVYQSRYPDTQIVFDILIRSHGFFGSAAGKPDAAVTPEVAKQKALAWAATRDVRTEAAVARLLWDTIDNNAGALRHNSDHPAKIQQTKGVFTRIADGFDYAFNLGAADRKLVWFILFVFLVMASAQTLHGASYWALGIEIAPSYEGRTRAMAYRSVTNSTFSIFASAFLPLSLMPFFADFQAGNQTIATASIFVVIPIALWSFLGTRERTVIVRSNKKKTSFWRSVKEIGAMPEFWRLTGLYIFLGKVMGIFRVFGLYLLIYYVFDGDLLLGTSYGAIMQALTMLVAIIAVPLVVWLCARFEKQNAFRLSLALLLLGSVLQYFCYNPEIPELVFIVPFFYGLAHAALYNILATMMADVTDLDERINGERREGMFGAVVSVFNKSASTFSMILSGILVVATGFDIEKGAMQAPGVFHNMLVAFSLVPAVVGVVGFALLIRYPLTRAYCNQLKEELAVQRARIHAENQA